jgi:hypothetical protein
MARALGKHLMQQSMLWWLVIHNTFPYGSQTGPLRNARFRSRHPAEKHLKTLSVRSANFAGLVDAHCIRAQFLYRALLERDHRMRSCSILSCSKHYLIKDIRFHPNPFSTEKSRPPPLD